MTSMLPFTPPIVKRLLGWRKGMDSDFERKYWQNENYRVGTKEWPPYSLRIRAFFEFSPHFLSVDLAQINFLQSSLD